MLMMRLMSSGDVDDVRRVRADPVERGPGASVFASSKLRKKEQLVLDDRTPLFFFS